MNNDEVKVHKNKYDDDICFIVWLQNVYYFKLVSFAI